VEQGSTNNSIDMNAVFTAVHMYKQAGMTVIRDQELPLHATNKLQNLSAVGVAGMAYAGVSAGDRICMPF
jgi:hypothetical protein